MAVALAPAQSFAAGEQSYKHTKRLMEWQQYYNDLNRGYTEQAMLAAWNRENEYNDPSAVAQRYRKAGISPQAALTGAASGAGVAGSMSVPGPAAAPNASFDFPDIGRTSMAAQLNLASLDEIRARTDKTDAERENIEADTESKKNENSIFDLIARIRAAEADSKESSVFIDRIAKEFSEVVAIKDVEERDQRIN